MPWLRILVALPVFVTLGVWLLVSGLRALRTGSANAGGKLIVYRKRPVFFVVTVLVQLSFALLALWEAFYILNGRGGGG